MIFALWIIDELERQLEGYTELTLNFEDFKQVLLLNGLVEPEGRGELATEPCEPRHPVASSS